MSMKLAKTIQFSICILKARTPLVEVSLSVPMSSLTSPMIGKNWQTINVIASAINMFISRSTLFPRSNKITLFMIDKMPKLYFCNDWIRYIGYFDWLPCILLFDIAFLFFWNIFIFLHVWKFNVITIIHGIISTKTTLEITT